MSRLYFPVILFSPLFVCLPVCNLAALNEVGKEERRVLQVSANLHPASKRTGLFDAKYELLVAKPTRKEKLVSVCSS